MLAPQRPNTPVQVLDHHLIRRSNLTASDDQNGKGREGLVGTDGRRGEHPEEMLKGINGTACNTGREDPSSTRATVSASQVLPTSQTTHTVAIHATPSATSKPEGGARVEIGLVPEQNQDKPHLNDAKIEAPVLPGVNQDTSNMFEIPKPVSPAADANPSTQSGAPAITVNRPLPGQNQETPILGELAPPPAPSPPGSALPPSLLLPLSLLSVTSSAYAPALASVSSAFSVQATTTPTSLSTSASSTTTSVITSSCSFTLSPITSFVTITRSEQGKEESPVTLALLGTTSILATSTSTSTNENGTPQAIAAAQSVSGFFSTTTAIAQATLNPTAVLGNQNGSILHPTARTLLVLFVILGSLSILVGIIIFMMVRSHKKRSRVQQQTSRNQSLYDTSNDHIGVTTHLSADSSGNAFLTASEKAIIDRAASPDGVSDMNNLSIFSDAISSFIEKSRRLTYKISP